MRHNPERLAWTVLISAFVTFCLLFTLIPVGGRWWVQNAAREQKITQSSTGTVRVTRPGRSTAEVNLLDIPVGSTIVTDPNSQASLTFATANGQEVLANITVYGNTAIEIQQADTPRFGWGINSNRINLRVRAGRVRAILSTGTSRETVVRLFSPPDAVTVLGPPGSNALVEATLEQTSVTVREGEATVVAQNLSQAIRVPKGQRTEITATQTQLALLPAERNLIVNSDFLQPITEGWVTEIRNTPNDITGTVNVVDISGGRRAANFFRPGANWGEVAITQEINKDVTDFTGLHLQLDVRVKFQDLWNCGERGSECPLMVKIKYIDAKGSPQEWVKGYFYKFTDNPGILAPLICVSCPPPTSPHEQISPAQWQTVESGNLLDIFRAAGAPAATIKSITFNASGHAFDSEITEVQLLASE
jgi:hypothetical protein